MFKILVTNDDGIQSPGLKAAVEALSEIATVYVVAPKTQQSATSRHITFLRTLNAEEIDFEGAEVAYSIDGTPTDCVMWAFSRFGELVDFDFLVSGINMGENTASAAYYSATVAAALEGSMHGVRSVALSVEGHETVNFEYICSMIPEVLESSHKLDPSIVLNVNAPDLEAWRVKGVRIADLAPEGRCPQFVYKDTDDGGYQLSVKVPEFESRINEDYSCVRDGYAVITPLCPDMSCPAEIRTLKGLSVDSDLFVLMGVQDKALAGMNKAKRFEAAVEKLSMSIGRLDLPMLVTRNVGMGPAMKFTEKSDKAELIDVIDFDGFKSKEFSELTKAISGRRVYLAGLETHIAVQQTALSFLRRGYDVTIIEDCCTAARKEDHKIAVENLRAEGCHIMSCEAVVMQLVGGSRHPAYNTIKAIFSE